MRSWFHGPMALVPLFWHLDTWHPYIHGPLRTMTSCPWSGFGQYVRRPRTGWLPGGVTGWQPFVLKQKYDMPPEKNVSFQRITERIFRIWMFYSKELGVGDSQEVAPKSTMKCWSIRSCLSCILVAWDAAVTRHGDGLWQEDCILVKTNGGSWEHWRKSYSRVSKFWTVGE